jgi:hypothetical protein
VVTRRKGPERRNENAQLYKSKTDLRRRFNLSRRMRKHHSPSDAAPSRNSCRRCPRSSRPLLGRRLSSLCTATLTMAHTFIIIFPLGNIRRPVQDLAIHRHVLISRTPAGICLPIQDHPLRKSSRSLFESTGRPHEATRRLPDAAPPTSVTCARPAAMVS